MAKDVNLVHVVAGGVPYNSIPYVIASILLLASTSSSISSGVSPYLPFNYIVIAPGNGFVALPASILPDLAKM